MKIYVRLAGGMGNQLFQLAAAINLSKRLGIPYDDISLDTRFLCEYESRHKFEIEFLTNFFPGVKVGQPASKFAQLASRFRLGRIINRRISFVEFVATASRFDQITSRNSAKIIVMDGYFQNPELLFQNDLRRSIYCGLIEFQHRVKNLINCANGCVGIHIRRGDYVSSSAASKVFRTVPLEYYRMALGKLQRDKKLFIFSDDKQVSAAFAEEVCGVDVGKMSLTLQEEFSLLMACNDHIIANSTFSWWAAYLGHREGGRIFSPLNWYIDAARSQENPLILPHFELIDV